MNFRLTDSAAPVRGTLSNGDPKTPAVASTRLSIGLWLPCIWYFLLSIRAISRMLEDFGKGAAAGGSIETAVFVGLLGLGLLTLVKRRVKWLEFVRHNKWLTALFAYTVLSALWSNFPTETIIRSFRNFGNLVMVLVVLSEANQLEAIAAVLRRCFYAHLPASLITVKYFRAFGVHYTWDGTKEGWRGLTFHKNNLAQVAQCSGTYFTWNLLKTYGRKRIITDLMMLAISLYLLRGSGSWNSTTSSVVFVISVITIIGLRVLQPRVERFGRYAFALPAIMIVIGGALAQVGAEAFLETTASAAAYQAMGRDETLTGRTPLWSDLFDIADRSPVLGVGYGALWNIGPSEPFIYPLPRWTAATPAWRPAQAHDGYIDVYVQTGWVGILLLAGVIISAFRNIARGAADDFEGARLRTALILPIVIDNISESSLLSGTHSLWFVFLMCAVTLPPRAKAGAQALSPRQPQTSSKPTAPDTRRKRHVAATATTRSWNWREVRQNPS